MICKGENPLAKHTCIHHTVEAVALLSFEPKKDWAVQRTTNKGPHCRGATSTTTVTVGVGEDSAITVVPTAFHNISSSDAVLLRRAVADYTAQAVHTTAANPLRWDVDDVRHGLHLDLVSLRCAPF